MHRQRLGVGLPTMSDEDEVPLDIMALRTLEGVVLEAKDTHGVVPVHSDQGHLSAARKTTHRRTHRDKWLIERSGPL
jgi:hypothetical protein